MGTTTTTRRNTNTNKNTRLHSKLDPKRAKRMSRSGKMIVEIETLPFPEGNSRNKYHNVEEAISIVEKSGLKYEVSPLCTTLEGSPDEVWSVLRRMHEATLQAGAEKVHTNIKLCQAAQDSKYNEDNIESLTRKYRGQTKPTGM